MAADELAVEGAAAAAAAQIEKNVAKKEEPTPEKEEKLHDAALERCPCCAWKLADMNPPKPAEADKKEYVRSIMAKRRFAKTYSLFGGDVTAQYKMLTADQANLLTKALRSIPISDNVVVQTTQALKLKLLFYLSQLNEDKFEVLVLDKDTDLGSFDGWMAAYDHRFGDYSEDVPILLTRVLMEFTRLAEMLPGAGLDENFWKGAGLA